jgi:hypothetical protein
MTQDLEKEPILQMIWRHVYDKPFTSDFLIEVNGRRGFNLTEKGH